jgi:hypothetical protein
LEASLSMSDPVSPIKTKSNPAGAADQPQPVLLPQEEHV